MPQLALDLLFDQISILIIMVLLIVLFIQLVVFPIIIRFILMLENTIARKHRFFLLI